MSFKPVPFAQNVIQQAGLGTVDASNADREPTINKDMEMAHQLYVLQTLLFNMLEERKLTAAMATDTVR